MKKILFAVAIATLVAITIFAQPNTSDQSLAYNSRPLPGRSELNVNAVRDFTKRFGATANATWSSNKDRLRATFVQGDIRNMIDYDHKGRWVSTIRVYDEDHLLRDIRKTVKSIYIDFSIVKVIEVNIGKSHVYFVKLENKSSLLTLHIMNGEITEIENYRKG